MPGLTSYPCRRSSWSIQWPTTGPSSAWCRIWAFQNPSRISRMAVLTRALISSIVVGYRNKSRPYPLCCDCDTGVAMRNTRGPSAGLNAGAEAHPYHTMQAADDALKRNWSEIMIQANLYQRIILADEP